MKRKFVIGMLLSSSVLFVRCRGCESEKPPVHLIRNMDTQEKGKAYRKDTTGLFADGRMWRAPVAGTVALGQLNSDKTLHEGLSLDATSGEFVPTQAFPEGLKRNGQLPESLADRGIARYRIYCAPCHGVQGDGKGPIAQREGLSGLQVAPAALTNTRSRSLVAGQLYAAIRNGVNNGNMGSYAAQIPVEDRWAIVAHIRRDIQQQPYESGEVVTVGPVDVASVEVGATLYKAKGCNACHSDDGSKLVGPTFRGMWGLTEATNNGTVEVDMAYFKESILQPMAKVLNGYPPAMPPQSLTDIEIESLALWVQSLQ